MTPKRLAFAILSLVFLSVVLGAPLTLHADPDRDSDSGSDSDSDSDSDRRTWNRPLLPTTGFNDLCGEPIFPDAPNFSFSALFNPDGSDPIVLTPEVCAANPDGELATWANPAFYAANGFPLPDSRLLNIPYNQVQIIVDPSGLRALVPDHAPGGPQPVPPTHSVPNEPDTIASFTDIGGEMELECFDDGTAEIEIEGYGYSPQAVMTMWIIWGNEPSTGLPPILPQPLGGAPNVVVADEDGEIEFQRTLNFCPMEALPGSVPLAIDIAKHIDGGNVYGGSPETPLATISFVDPDTGAVFSSQGLGAGMTTVDQGVIPLLIQP